MDRSSSDMYDAAVVGGGPAGLAAATWLARYRRRTIVFDPGEYRNRWVSQTHGYLGDDPTDPASLRDRAHRDVDRYDEVTLRRSHVTGARREDTGLFTLRTTDGQVKAHRVVLATGVVDVFPEIEGFFDHYGTSVFHCPTCDGYEARDRRVVAFGWSEQVAGFALELLDWAAEVTIVSDGHSFEGRERHREALVRHDIPVIDREAVRLVGEPGTLEGIELDDGRVIGCEMAFFSLGHRPRNELAVQLGCELAEEGYVAADTDGRTSVEGVYAAGDLTPGTQLVQVAASKGALAGVCCALSFRGERTSPRSPEPAPDVEAEVGS